MLINRFFIFAGFLISLVFAFSAQAIVNVENLRIDPDKQQSGFDGLFTLDINGNNGNTQNARAGMGAQLRWYNPYHADLVILDYAYGESADIKDTDKSFFHYRHVWHTTDTLSWEAFAQMETNEFTRLKLRSLIGAGIRLKLLDDPQAHTAYLGVGMLRSKEKVETLIGTTDAQEDYTTRLNIYQVYQYAISDHSRLVNMVYYQPDVSEFSDYRLLEQLAIKVDINDQLALKVSVDVVHDNRPPQSIEKTDTSYNSGLEYRF